MLTEPRLTRWNWPVAALLGVMVIASYATVIATAGWIWDDAEYVTRNPVLNGALDDGLWRIWTDMSATPQYYPLVFTSFWIEWQLFPSVVVTEYGQDFIEPDPTGFHVTNVLLMVATTWLFWRVLIRLAVPGAFLAAALFAVHPINVESVAWVTERKNMLSALFALATIQTYLRFAGVGSEESRTGRTWMLALTFWICGLLSKSVIAFVPPAIFLLIWWRRPQDWKRHVLPLLPFLAIGLLAGLNTARLEADLVSAGVRHFDLTLLDRLLLAGRIIWTYVAHVVWPVEQIFSYPKWQPDPSAPLQWLMLVGVFGFLAAAVASTRWLGRGPLVAVLIFGGGLVPVMGFFDVYPMRFSWVADHFQYHANFALIALLGTALTVFSRWLPVSGRVVGAVALLVTLGVLTGRQGLAYEDRETMWRDTLAKNPQSWIAHSNLGAVLCERGDLDAARKLFLRGHEIHPDALFLAGLANVEFDLYLRDKDPQHVREAIEWSKRALRLKPSLSLTRALLAELYELAGPQYRTKAVEQLELLHEFVLAEPRNRNVLPQKFQNRTLRQSMGRLHRLYGGLGRERLAAGDHRGAFALFARSTRPFAGPGSVAWNELYAWTATSPWFRLELHRIWMLACSKDDSVRDPGRAGAELGTLLSNFQQKMDQAGADPGLRTTRAVELLDLQAAVLAANGRFEDAKSVAANAAKTAREHGAPDAWVRGVEARRDLYGTGQPYRVDRELPFATGR